MMGERREERRRVRVGRAVSTAVVAVVAAVAVLAGCAVGKPRLIVDDAVVNANRKMEMDAEDFLERQHRSGHMSLERDMAVANYESGFVDRMHDKRVTLSVSKAWFDDESGNVCCSHRDHRVGVDFCHASLAASCRVEFGYSVVPVQEGETRQGKFSSCCKFVEHGIDSGICQRANCVVIAPGTSPALAMPGSHSVRGPMDGVRKTVHHLSVPNNIRAEVPNLPPVLRSLFFAEATHGKLLLEQQFGVYITIDDEDALIIYGASPDIVEQCMLLVEECVKNHEYCFQWYRGQRGTEATHTLVADGRSSVAG
eukprot:INCI13902.3.p1 GENE.INCI13902.3~~INCI13902.3.p1  ORF type:complete len:311 (+),score=57.66 INCI13902.3:106-1038(+)